MLETAVSTGNDPCLGLVDHQSAARKLPDVLSLRFTVFLSLCLPTVGECG
jgi:hypothetical protein